VEEDRVSAMSAAMLSLGERIATELGRGVLEQVYIRGENGYVLLTAVGEEAVLTVMARKQAKLGLILLEPDLGTPALLSAVIMDRDWVKIYRVGSGGHIGLVDGKRGYLRPSKDKPVMLSIMVQDINAWHRKLTEKGVKTNHPPREADGIHMRGFLTWDPSGYVIELLEFLTKPYGE